MVECSASLVGFNVAAWSQQALRDNMNFGWQRLPRWWLLWEIWRRFGESFWIRQIPLWHGFILARRWLSKRGWFWHMVRILMAGGLLSMEISLWCYFWLDFHPAVTRRWLGHIVRGTVSRLLHIHEMYLWSYFRRTCWGNRTIWPSSEGRRLAWQNVIDIEQNGWRFRREDLQGRVRLP